MTNLNKTAKQLIEEIRAAVSISDTEIGAQVDISQSTIGRLRSGAMADTSSENWKALYEFHKRVMRKAA